MERAGIFLMTAALIAGLVGYDGCNPPSSQNLEIRTWYDLTAVRDNLAGDHTLMNDLDSSTPGYKELASPTANGGKGWQPIGFYTPSGRTVYTGFMGTFDGQGYEIRDLYINRPDEGYVGLFGWLEGGWDGGGIIKDMGTVNVAVTGRDAVGGPVGRNMGTVTNSYSSGNITGVSHVGVLSGYSSGTVSDCYSTGNVGGEWAVGGLVGVNEGTVTNSHSRGNVTGEASLVGGLVGLSYGTVSNCCSTGNVTSNHYVGGLVGWNGGTVSNSHSSVSATGEWGAGGLVGGSDGFVSNSYSMGSVTGDMKVGGLIGENEGEGAVSNCFWDIETSGQATSDGGTGKTTVEMKSIATFSSAGWNIVAVTNSGVRNPSYIWNIVVSETYPFLSWQA